MSPKFHLTLTTALLLLANSAQATFITGPLDANYTTAFQGASAKTLDDLPNYTVGTNPTDLKVSIGTYTDPSGLTFGNMITPNASAYGGFPNPLNFGAYTIHGTNIADGNARDYNWVQNTGTNGTTNTALDQPWKGTIWDLGGQANQAVVFPIIDHDPLPAEAIEYTVYLTNDPSSTNLADWHLAILDQIYLQGWQADGTAIADGFTTVWKLANDATFQYVSVQAIGSQALYPIFGNEDEIDAVAGLTAEGGGLGGGSVPEPGSLALAGLGLAALAYARRRKSS